MGVRLRFEPRDLAREVSGELLSRWRDKRPLYDRIALFMAESIRENFRVGGRPRKWKQSRRAGQQRGQTLRDKNILMNSITGRGGAERAVAGTNDPRAAVHHFGARKGEFGTVQAAVRAHVRRRRGKAAAVRAHSRKQRLPWGDIPARPFIMLQKSDLPLINQMVAAYLTGAR